MDERRTFSSLVLQFTLAANLCTFFYLMTLSTRTPNGYYPLSMLVYSPAVYLLNKLFLSRPQTMRRLVLLNTAVGALFFLSILLLGEQKEMLLLVFAAGFCLWITMKGGYRSLHAPTLHEMILSLDTSAVMLVLLMGYTSIMGSGILWVLPGAAGFAAACLGVAARRMYGAITIKGWALLGIAFVGIFGLMVLLVGVAAAPAGEGIVMLWNGLVTMAKGVLALLWRLLLFLSSLLPEMAAGSQPSVDHHPSGAGGGGAPPFPGVAVKADGTAENWGEEGAEGCKGASAPPYLPVEWAEAAARELENPDSSASVPDTSPGHPCGDVLRPGPPLPTQPLA